MTKLDIRIKKLNPQAQIPTYGTPFSAGADLYALVEQPIVIRPGETVLIHTGLAMEICEGYGGFVFARSGLATKKGLAPANKVGVIDADYRGEIRVILVNRGKEAFRIEPGDRIAQMVIAPVVRAQWQLCSQLDATERQDGGFGSTGRK